MSPSPAHSSTTKTILWLFLDPVNTNAVPHGVDLSGHDWLHMRTEEFMRGKLSLEMQTWFDFYAL